MTKFCFNEFTDKQVAQNLCVLILRKQTPTDTKLYLHKGKRHLQLSTSITNLRPMFHFFPFLYPLKRQKTNCHMVNATLNL